jgi:hypothetical protein
MPRPRKADRRHHQINLRFSAPEYVRVHAHAALTGKTVPDFARTVLLRRPRRRRGANDLTVVALSDAELAQWQALGTRLNDIAHLMNGRDGLPPSDLVPLLGRLRQLFNDSLAPIAAGDAKPAAYTLAPPVRHHLRKVGVNLTQIRRRLDQLRLEPPVILIRLLERARTVMNGDQPPDAA